MHHVPRNLAVNLVSIMASTKIRTKLLSSPADGLICETPCEEK